MLKALDDYDWAEVFGEGSGGNCTPIIPDPVPGFRGSTATFCREDVKLISGMSEGEPDGRDWVVFGKLKDGRWVAARGGCDYTGWDCRASNSGSVAGSKKAIVALGMDQSERDRMGLNS